MQSRKAVNIFQMSTNNFKSTILCGKCGHSNNGFNRRYCGTNSVEVLPSLNWQYYLIMLRSAILNALEVMAS